MKAHPTRLTRPIDLGFSYDLGKTETLRDISLKIPKNMVTAFIGPSGCGKSTLLRCLNRMNDLIDTAKVTRGTITDFGDLDIVRITKPTFFQGNDSNHIPALLKIHHG